jgi:hypothetical protein
VHKSVFAAEWRRCLEAQYMDVVRRGDTNNRKSLQQVMLRVGFREDDLRALYVRATMRAEDLPDDFQLDASQLPAPAAVPEPMTFTPHPAECTCPSCLEQVDLLRHDDEGQPLSRDEQLEKRARLASDDEAASSHRPIQRSLF